MNVLVACEESQAVTKEFRRLGHTAFSCDLLEPQGGVQEWHILQDCRPLIDGNCEFKTMDGQSHEIVGKWDMLIAFPPCTHLAVSGARHFSKKYLDGRQWDGIQLFAEFLYADCDRIAVENPMGIISGGHYIEETYPKLAKRWGFPKKYTQIIQPYEYGDPARKTTCLWLKNLPRLVPTNVVEPTLVQYKCKSGKVVTFDEYMVKGFDGDRARHRSKTFPGIAKAMAEQWGSLDVERSGDMRIEQIEGQLEFQL